MNLNIIKIHYPYIEPASYDSLCPHTHFKKNVKSFKILHTCAGPVILDKTEFFFLKAKIKLSIEKGYQVSIQSLKKRNIYIAVFICDTDI